MTPEERRELTTLTKEHLRAMRDANDCVVFRHPRPDQDDQHVGVLEARVEEVKYGKKVTVSVDVPCVSGITNYEETKGGELSPTREEIDSLYLQAVYVMHWPKGYDSRWAPIVAQCRVGDQISLDWCRGNHNQITRDLGIAVDHLEVGILRKGRRVATFLLAYSVGKKNCARMVSTTGERRTYG